MKGIDVSRWQGNINWSAVKNDGIEFAIIKAGGSDAGFYKDPYFEKNYSGCKANGIYVGAYYFVGAGCTSKADGEADAKRFLEFLKGKQFEMPVYIDFEAPNGANKQGNTDACIGFNEVMENAGYYAGVYASDYSGFKDRLNKDALKPYTWWVAHYGGRVDYATANSDIWQYSSTGRVAGINGNVDMDECYKDFPTIIKNGGFNGYTKETASQPVNTPETPKQPVEQPTERTYTVQRGDTLSAIASKYGTTYQHLAEINGISNPNLIYAGQVLKIDGNAQPQQNTAVYYTVQSGDTLSGIASKYGTTYQHLAQMNGIANPNLIYAGQKIRVK